MRGMQGNPHYGSADHLKQGNEADQRFAQIEATLALAFEQHTANLIALWKMEAADVEHLNDGTGMSETEWQSVAEQIAGRLGLA